MITQKGSMPKTCLIRKCPGEFKSVQHMLETLMKIKCRNFRPCEDKPLKCVWGNSNTIDILEPDMPHHECLILGVKKPKKKSR